MSGARSSRLTRLRASLAALALLIAAVSSPIALATQTADVCGMACCVKEGRCCCNPHHASVKGQIADDKPRIGESELSAACPESCATAVRSANLFLSQHLRPGAQHVVIGKPASICLVQPIAIRDLVGAGASTPRAPPSSLTI
jgi:hypothetical protein